MQTQKQETRGKPDTPPPPQTEAEAHRARAAELARRAPGVDPEICLDFDAAIEFAALEGRSIVEAIDEFLADLTGKSRAALATLANRPGTPLPPGRRKLAMMPKAASMLLRTTEDSTSPADLERIASSDAVMTGMLVGAANSARFGSRFAIVRLRDAIMRVGVPEARKILLSACFSTLFASKSLEDLWEHSQKVADAACGLATLAGIDPETAWIAGLLHDIGRVGFHGFPARQRVAEQDWVASGFPLAYAESLVYGFDHASFGAAILTEWGLPEPIVDAVRRHHTPERAQTPSANDKLAALIGLAEAEACGTGAADRDASVKSGASVNKSVNKEELWPALRRRAACDRIGVTIAQLEAFKAGSHSRQTACA